MVRILLVSTMRDEGPHLLEWIAHHRALGVSDFLIFSNDCTDGTTKMLDALGDFGVVHLPNNPPKNKSLQWNALKEAWGHPCRKSADWIFCIDSDEFVNLRAPLSSLSDLVAKIGEADAITLPWRLFGHSGQSNLTSDLTMELFTHSAPPGCDYPVSARQFKTLFRNKGPFRQIGVHRPRTKKDANARWVDGSGQSMPDMFARAEHRINLYGMPAASDLVQLNHYSVRSAESFMLKRARGLPNRKDRNIDLTYWVERNFNTDRDVSIRRHLEKTKSVMSKMLAVPNMAELHTSAHAHHHREFQRIIKNEAEAKLYGRLLLMSSSTPLSREMTRQLVAMYQESQGNG